MSEFFAFETLTWPDVARLPRQTPLVIPLGEGYELARLAEMLDHPARIGLLPAIPFGWRGSGMEVSDRAFSRVVANLLNSLADDGFSRQYVLAPPQIDLDLGPRQLILPHPSYRDLPLSFPPSGEQEKVVVIPIGHTEQHGHHLPLSTDTIIIDAIGQGVVSSSPALATLVPTFPYGVSTHRASFAGTLNVGGRAFEDFWLEVVDVLVTRGFWRIYLISGHGGSCSFLVNVVKYAGERHRRIFCATDWLHTAGHIAAPVLQQTRRSARGGMGHAGELETALMLHLRPSLVHMERVVDETDFVTTDSYYMDWIEGGALIANPPWDDDTATGAYGAGSVATRENGKRWLEVGISEKVAHVREIVEQHKMRERRRQAGFGLWGR